MGLFHGPVTDNIMVATWNTEKRSVAFSLSTLLHNQGSRSLLAAFPTGSEHIRDGLEAPWNVLRSQIPSSPSFHRKKLGPQEILDRATARQWA